MLERGYMLMLQMPVGDIVKKIREAKNLSEEDIKARIKKKLSELSGLISEEGAAHIVANELGVKLFDPSAPLTIDKLAGGLRGITVTGKVRAIYEVREFSSETRTGKVGNFLLSDKTGTTRVVLWNDQADQLKELTVGDTLKITGAYTRNNQGRVEVHLGSDAKMEKNPPGVTIDVDVTTQPARTPAPLKKIAELSAEDQNVSVLATIVQVFDPRFFAVCPECNARLREESGMACATHGTVTAAYNAVMNLYLDDGTDNIRCVLWREQVADLLGKTKEELVKLKDDAAAFEPYKTDLLGMIVKVRGRINNNESFGRLELVAYEIEKDAEPAEELPKAPVQQALQQDAPKKEPEKAAPAPQKPVAKTPKPVQETPKAVTEGSKPAPKVPEQPKTPEKPKPAPAAADEEEVFTLDDIEDLEDL